MSGETILTCDSCDRILYTGNRMRLTRFSSARPSPARRVTSLEQLQLPTLTVDPEAIRELQVAAFTVVDEHGQTLASLSEPLGIKTNNVAEYSALIAALKFARSKTLPRSSKVISRLGIAGSPNQRCISCQESRSQGSL